MPSTTRELLDLLVLDQWDDHTLRGRHPQTHLRRSYGGQVLAQALMASSAAIPNDRLVHSLHAYFLQQGRVDRDIDYRVDILRDGRSFSTRHVTALQSEPIFTMSTSYHVAEAGLDHFDLAPTVVLNPKECRPFHEVMNERFDEWPVSHEWDALDVRFIADSAAPGPNPIGSHPAHLQVWVRTEGAMPDDPQLHLAVLAYLSDLTLSSVAVLPHKIAFISTNLQVASLSHSMWFHRPARADEWLLYDMVSPSAAASIGFSFGRIFQDGRLVASCAQEGLIRLVKDRPPLT